MGQVRNGSAAAVVRISRGAFPAGRCDEVKRLIGASAAPLVPAIIALRGLVYYHASVDSASNTVVSVSVWTDLDAAQQMDHLAEMLAQRPILERAGVQFEPIANYEPLWTIGGTL